MAYVDRKVMLILPILTSIDSTTQNIRDMGRLKTVTKLSL